MAVLFSAEKSIRHGVQYIIRRRSGQQALSGRPAGSFAEMHLGWHIPGIKYENVQQELSGMAG